MSGVRVLSTGSSELFQAAVDEAAALLRAGNVVAIPTETVYGLAANALNPDAVAHIFSIKGRPARNPIIVHVSGIEMARECAALWPRIANELAERFWPGPLTLVLPRSKKIPDIVTSSGPTVGLRSPAHDFVQALIRTCGFPLAAPSANPAGQLSPTTAEHVRRGLGNQLRLIVDGGPTRVGIESTVLDVTVTPPRILRPGMIDGAAIQTVIGTRASLAPDTSADTGSSVGPTVLRSPGLLEKHYSPKARLVIGSWTDESEFRNKAEKLNVPFDKIHVLTRNPAPMTASFGRTALMPDQAAEFARVLYDQLHRSDELGAELIIMEAPPETPEWEPIWDRLRRAATRFLES